MKYLSRTPNASGAYPAPQSSHGPGMLAISDEQAAMVIQYNGFVTISEGEDGEPVLAPDTEAWEAWKATLPPEPPEPEPSELDKLKEKVDGLEQDKADKTEVQAVWDSMAAAYQEGVQGA